MDMKFVSIPFRPAFADTVKALKIDSELEDEFRDIYEKCIAVARPKAVFCLVPVHQEGARDRHRHGAVQKPHHAGQSAGRPPGAL